MYSAGFVIKALTLPNVTVSRSLLPVYQTVMPSAPHIQNCATIAFAFTNIPYFAVKVNALYRSLIFFGRNVHFQRYFFSNNNINRTSKK